MRESTRSRFTRSCICLFALITVLCSLAVGCSQGTGPESVMSASSDIGTNGGEVELIAPDGTECRLTIPAGLLSATTEIKITAVSSSKGSSLGALSNDFLVEPEGLEFDTPVTIDITIANPVPDDRVPAILHTAANGSGILLETQVDGQTLTASLTHFSYLGPVAPTAQELELYWDTAELEIEANGLSVERVHRLASAYLHAQADPNAYASIDLSLWEQRLWAHTNDLIIMGSLQCSSGDREEGGYILRAARGFAALCFFADLELEAEQAIASCCPTGTIVIDQTPDALSGAGWSLTGPQNRTGSGDTTLTGMAAGEYTLAWNEVGGYVKPSTSVKTLGVNGTVTFGGSYVEYSGPPLTGVWVRMTDVYGKAVIYLNDRAAETAYYGTWPGGQGSGNPGDSGWDSATNLLQQGANTFRFWVGPFPSRPSKPRANFEVWVDGVQVITRSLVTDDPNATLEETVTLTF